MQIYYRYPLNFVRKIFNPYFMDRLHNQQPESEVAYTRRQLHLFDTSMNIEAKNYTGPYLPKDREEIQQHKHYLGDFWGDFLRHFWTLFYPGSIDFEAIHTGTLFNLTLFWEIV